MPEIYEYEQSDGLTEKLQNSFSIALVFDPTKVHLLDDEEKLKVTVGAAEEFVKQIDLFYFESVLASTGWNKNDDVFDKAELWNARLTPVNKKINYMHDEHDIIGHMIRSFAMDNSNTSIDFDSDVQNIPDNFNLMVGGVLYKIWQKPELQERMDLLLAEISDRKWKVSMECLFTHFDYAVITPDGKNRIIARNNETSFLTKHLRRYGGNGEFDGYKIGRLLRNITFSGKAMVTNPAGPKSVIVKTENEIFSGTVATIETLPDLNKPNDENVRTENKTMAEFTQAQYDELKTRLEKAEAAAKDAAEQAVKREIETLQASIKDLETSKAKLEAEISASKEVVKAHEDKSKSLETELEATKANLAKANEELAKNAKEVAKAKRLAMFAEKEIDAAKAEELVNKFADASDEMFAELVKAMPMKKAKAKDGDKEDKDAKDAKAALDDAKLKDNGGSLPPDDDKHSTASAWFSNIFQTTEKKQGE